MYTRIDNVHSLCVKIKILSDRETAYDNIIEHMKINVRSPLLFPALLHSSFQLSHNAPMGLTQLRTSV